MMAPDLLGLQGLHGCELGLIWMHNTFKKRLYPDGYGHEDTFILGCWADSAINLGFRYSNDQMM